MPRIEVPNVTVESFIVKAGNDYATVFLRHYANPVKDDHATFSGTLCIHSSYGTYGHFWSCMGSSLKEFLAGIGTDYLLSKISRTETDWDSAEARLKKAVIEARKSGAKPGDCRDAWEAINDAFADYSGRDAAMSLYHDGSLNKVIHDWDLFTTTYPNDAMQFVKRMWPEIVACLNEPVPA